MARIITLADRSRDEDPLVALRSLGELRQESDRLEVVLVRRARNRGSTWEEIASALGVSRQAVHKRHGGTRFRR